MEPLWKLPPYDLSPTKSGGWAVQSEDGFGAALAVFAPLRNEGGWKLAMDDAQLLELTPVRDDRWTEVSLPPEPQGPQAPQATHFLCLLRYDHPAEHPGSTYLRMELASETGPRQAKSPVVAGLELRPGLQRVIAHLAERLDLFLVPAPPRTGSGTAPAMAMARDLSARASPPAAELPDKLTFAFGSCQYPAGMMDRPMAFRSYDRLAKYLDEQIQKEWPERLLLLGDQVYTDATYGLIDPAQVDDRYRIPYEEFNDRENGPFARLPQTFLARRRLTLDDHELRDNWEPRRVADPVAVEGLKAYWKYQRRAPLQERIQLTESGPGWRLFMADSRTQRTPRTEDTLETANILGEEQWADLEDWLQAAPSGELSIVTTAAMLLPRTRMYIDEPLYLDAWQGFPASLHRLLALLCDKRMRNVVFLSGDAHLACDARVQVTCPGSDRHATFAALHAPALYAPYPFANEDPANLLLQDSFGFDWDGRHYHCTVSAQVLADGANGCGLLRATRHDERWCVGYEVLLPQAAAAAAD